MYSSIQPNYRFKERLYENNEKTVVIYRARRKKEIRQIAIKAYYKPKNPLYYKEYTILKEIRNPWIIKVEGASEDKNNFYMEMEYCSSGALSKCIFSNRVTNYSEKVLKEVSTQILIGLRTLHKNGIIHCNLKPSNILIDEFGNTRICDFKKALKVKDFSKDDIKTNKCAMTPCYTAPELFSDNGYFSFKTDLWSLGCIMYEMGAGHVPFYDTSLNNLILKIINNDVNFNKKQFNKYSDEYMDVIHNLLEKDPERRPSWGDIENFPFWNTKEKGFYETFPNLTYNNELKDKNSPFKNQLSNNINYSELKGINIGNQEQNNYKNNYKQNSYEFEVFEKLENVQINLGEKLSYSKKPSVNMKKYFKKKKLFITQEDIGYNRIDKNIPENDKEFSLKNNQNEEENYSANKLKNLERSQHKNILSLSSLNINKIMDKNKLKKSTESNESDERNLSLADPIELSQIQYLMIHKSDNNIKPIMGNHTIEPKKDSLIFDISKILITRVYKMGELIELFKENQLEELDKFFKDIYVSINEYIKNKNNDSFLNLLNYFETIILSKDISNCIINTPLLKLIIDCFNIEFNDKIRLRACSILGNLIRYSTHLNVSLEKYNLVDTLISFISDTNIALARKAMATLGEYIFFVFSKAEKEVEADKTSSKKIWTINQGAIKALLYALNHLDEKIKFYSLQSIENICSATTIAKNYFCDNDEFISKIIEIYNTSAENQEIKSRAICTISHMIRLNPNLMETFIDKMDDINIILGKENQKNIQYIINCLLFGIERDKKKIKFIATNKLTPTLLNLLENCNDIIKGKILLFLKFIINDTYIIIKYGERFFHIINQLKKEKKFFFFHIKILESSLENFCKILLKNYKNISEEYQISKNKNEISKKLDNILICLNVISLSNAKVAYSFYNIQLLKTSLYFLINCNINDEQISLILNILKGFSENSTCVIENCIFIINQYTKKMMTLIKSINKENKRLPLNICANIISVLLEDEKVYSSTSVTDGLTNDINNLIIEILPNIFGLLKNNDTVYDSLGFLSLIVGHNIAFIRFYREIGIIDYIFFLMKEENYYSNLSLIKIFTKFIESNETSFNDIIDLNLIDKINYFISKDNHEEITIYTEYIIEMLFDLLFKLNEIRRKLAEDSDIQDDFLKKIEKIAMSFELNIRLLSCNNNNLKEIASINLIFFLQFFPNKYIQSIKVNVHFKENDIPYLLEGLESGNQKIYKKLIKIFKWIIEYQNDAKKILKNYISYIQICIEKIINISNELSLKEIANNFLNEDIPKLI